MRKFTTFGGRRRIREVLSYEVVEHEHMDGPELLVDVIVEDALGVFREYMFASAIRAEGLTPAEVEAELKALCDFGPHTRSLVPAFTDHSVGAGCVCTVARDGKPATLTRAQADPDPGDVHPAGGDAGSATNVQEAS